MSPRRPAISRRSLGAGSVVALTLATGCAPTRTRSSAPPTPTGAAPADEELVLAALAAEQQMVDQLATARPISATLEAARAVHQAHVELLDEAAAAAGLSPGPTAAPRPPDSSTDASTPAQVTRLAVEERRLVAQHTEAAVGASSGTFARVLAGMAAAAAQQAVLLERSVRQPAPGPEGTS